MIVFKKINSLYILLLSLTVFSCTSKGIYQSAQIVKKLQNERNLQYFNFKVKSNLYLDSVYKSKNWKPEGHKFFNKKRLKKAKSYNDSIYDQLYNYRNQFVNKFIEDKAFKDFVLIEKFGVAKLSSPPEYWGYIIQKDSIYWIDNNKIIKSKKLSYNTASISCLVYTFQGNSVIINRGIDIDANSNCKQQTNKELFSDYRLDRDSYLSNYKNGKLNLLMYKDSIVYENKTNMVFKLEEEKYFNEDLQEYCILKQDIMKCKDLTFKCKRYDGLVMFCDTIRGDMQ